jgi:F-type H+-transporting ATPase subunit b
MDLVTPDFGLIFWTLVTFLLLVFLLGKFAWKPILKMVDDREASIEDALKAAERARDEMKSLQSDNEAVLKEARQERERILKEAREMKNKIVSDGRRESDCFCKGGHRG